MPPPSLSTTTIRRSAARPREADQRVGVVHERDVADEGDRRRRPPAPGRARSTRRRRCRWRRGSRGASRQRSAEPLEVAHGHRRGHDEARRRRGATRRSTCATPGSVSDLVGGQRRLDRLQRTLLGVPPTGGPRRAGRPRAGPTRSSIAHTTATSWPGSTTPGPPTWTTTRDERAIHSASTLDAGGRPMRTTTSGECARRRTPDDGAARRTSSTAAGNERAPLDRIGEHGPSRRTRPAPRCARRAHPLRPPATITPR